MVEGWFAHNRALPHSKGRGRNWCRQFGLPLVQVLLLQALTLEPVPVLVLSCALVVFSRFVALARPRLDFDKRGPW